MPIRGILFDIGDTLLDATGIQRSATLATARDVAPECGIEDPARLAAALAAVDAEPRFDVLPDLNHLFGDARIVAPALERAGARPTAGLVERFLATYRRRVRAALRPDAGLGVTLRALDARGYRLGIISNGTTREQHEQLERLGIAALFDPILISQEVGVRKPDPAIFRLALARWHVEPEDVLVVGDRGDWEVLGAHRAGMRSALTTQFVDHRATIEPATPPDVVVGSLDELARWLEVHGEPEAPRR